MTKTFEDIVRGMTFREIVLAMVRGLRKRWVKVDMSVFGFEDKGVCWGCAATNTICEIAQKQFLPGEIDDRASRSKAIRSNSQFLYDFEVALDSLRICDMDDYNRRATYAGVAAYPKNYVPGPRLGDEYTEDDLTAWEKSVENLP